MMGMIGPVPSDWIKGASATSEFETPGLEIEPCEDYATLQNAWRIALKWTEGLDYGLSVMLASIISTSMLGDQLWIKVIGPAACGKSTLCEALSVNTTYIKAVSTMRGFHSGYQTDAKGEEDHSLLSKLRNRTLITKDGDTLLQSPNLSQILSEARDIYDTVSRTSYRNQASKDYVGYRLTWLLCGTKSIRIIDKSELGARFLDCVLMNEIDLELEHDIQMRVAHRANKNMQFEANGKPETQQEPEMIKAMKLTGGYVDYLRDNAASILSNISFSNEAKYRCVLMARFIAYFRARPSEYQIEEDEREVATRLTSQLVRLAKGLAGVMNRTEIDNVVMTRVKQITLDTSRGITLRIMDNLVDEEEGLSSRALAVRTNNMDIGVKNLMRFMKQLGMVRTFKSNKLGVVWRPTKAIRTLYQEVVED
jgi:hypothetical protein